MKSFAAAVVSSSICLPALLGQRAGVLNPLLAHTSPAWLFGCVVLVGRPRVEDATGLEALAEVREVFFRRIVRPLRLLFAVQVVEVAEELVEPVHSGQVLVEIAQMILPELSGCIPERFEELGNGRIFSLHDKTVGELLDLVDQLGITDNTIVMYSTDNGPHMNTWPDGAMTPFRNEKNT